MKFCDIRECEVCKSISLGRQRLMLDLCDYDFSIEKELKIESPLFRKKDGAKDIIYFIWDGHLIQTAKPIGDRPIFFLVQVNGFTYKEDWEILCNIPSWLESECRDDEDDNVEFIGAEFTEKEPSIADEKSLMIAKVCFANNIDEYHNPMMLKLKGRLFFYLADNAKYGQIKINDKVMKGYFIQTTKQEIADKFGCAESSIRRNLEMLEFDSNDIESYEIDSKKNTPTIYRIVC